jgi:lipopolysaccharide export system permease protein
MLIGRTVLREVSRNFLGALGASTAIVFFVMAMTFMKKQPGVGLGLLIELFPMFFPLALQFTVPASMLAAVVLTFSRMQVDGELTALSASGVNLVRVVWPVLAGAAVVAVASLILVEVATPMAAARLRDASRDLAESMQTSFRSGVRDIQFSGTRISFDSYDRGEFSDVLIDVSRKKKSSRIVRARGGSFEITKDDHIRFELSPLHVLIPAEEGKDGREGKGRTFLSFESIAARISLDEMELGRGARRRTDLAAWELAHVWERGIDQKAKKLIGGRISSLEAGEELARRTALAGSVFFFALVGVSLGVIAGRRAKVAAVIVACGPVVVTYFPLVILGANLARGGSVSPYVALWLGNMIFAVVGAALLFRVVRR